MLELLFFAIIQGGIVTMQNSKVRFKLYKAKKNWVSAGLVTTAVLAGLTLGSVKNNDVVAHADSNVQTTQTTAQKQQVTQGEYDAQKAKVDQANNDVQNQTTVVNNDKSALDQASGVNNVAKAKADYDAAAKN